MNRYIFPFIAMILLVTGCSDDDSFSSSPSQRLTFSADTLVMDTVFSKVPSPTHSFWVYNNSGDGIRCSSIRLAKGNQTGFRVNVNGTYLGEKTGYMVSNEEIRKNDSIRIFVELTSPLNNGSGPIEQGEDIEFLLESGVRQSVHLKAWSWDADLRRDIVISTDSTLSSSKPLVVYGGITVNEGATLTLAPGTTLFMHGDAAIDVHGRLVCNGTPDNEVTLRGDRLDRMFDYLPYDGVSGQWKGIRFHESSYDNSISFTDIHGAFDAIVCDSSDVARTKLSIHSSTVHNNQGYGIMATCCRLFIENTQITNCLRDCLFFKGGNIVMNSSTVAQFYPFDGLRGNALAFFGSADYPLTRLDISNSIVTAYAEDALMGSTDANEGDDTEAFFAFSFDHCLLRTPAVNDDPRFTDIIWEEPEDTVSAGAKNFRNIDTDNLRYDFSLSEKSKAVGAANINSATPADRRNVPRDETPDIGCYEAQQETNKEN